MGTLNLTDPDGAAASTENKRRIAVIGGGFGGLACGYELSCAGYIVDIFEARNRLGGRVHSVDRFAPGRVTEFGAELIGGNHPQWLKYAQKFGIELESLADDGEPIEIIMNGRRYKGDEAKLLADEIDRGHNELAVDAALADWECPWNTPNAEIYDKQTLQDRITRLVTTDRAKQAIAIEFMMDMACNPAKMNYLALMCVIKAHGVDKYWTETEMYRARQGNQILASHLATEVSGRIHLDCPVIEINRNSSGCRIKIKDGRSFDYADVILAVPPTIYRNIKFTPTLPAGFDPQMGTATKFLGVVERAYWLPEGQSDLMTDTPVGMTWEGAAVEDNPARLLVSFTGGAIADALHSRPLTGRERFVTEQFEKVLPGFASNHVKSELVDWIDDQWTRGGYSFPRPGEFLSQSRILRDGLGNLHFAGEHASTGWFGFMEGGLHSGVQVANRLIGRDQK